MSLKCYLKFVGNDPHVDYSVQRGGGSIQVRGVVCCPECEKTGYARRFVEVPGMDTPEKALVGMMALAAEHEENDSAGVGGYARCTTNKRECAARTKKMNDSIAEFRRKV